MKITEFDITFCRENVFMLIDCNKDSDVYDEVVDEYEEMLEEAYRRIEPVALLAFGDVSEYGELLCDEEGVDLSQALYCLISVGGRMSEWATQLFGQGDYLRGMIADAMADDYLFQIDHQLVGPIMELCKERNFGVARRLEAPQDVPMSAQKRALEITDGERLAGIQILESFMYNPVKSTCQIYLLKENSDLFRIQHDCSSCRNLNCKLRKTNELTVTVKQKEKQFLVSGKKGQNLLAILQQGQVYLSAICAGKGTCGKCKVQVLEGQIMLSPADLRYFSEAELAAGYRFACLAYPEEDCVIALEEHLGEDDFEVVSNYGFEKMLELDPQGRYGVAVDIGTTTIAMQLVELESGKLVKVYTAINRQRAYGADVISRIESSNQGRKDILQKTLLEDLRQGLKQLTGDGDHSSCKIEKMVIAANTTMVHLLMGYSCETLGVFPFTPVNIDTIHTSYEKLFKETDDNFDIMIYPGISTYVGGDITAGLYALEFDRKEEVSVLIDLGTNGEIAIGNRDKILVASTAAGPAFEGGNISHGMGSVPGAVCRVSLVGHQSVVSTIQDKAPLGICGTGVIDITYELLKAGFIDETGMLDEEYFKTGYPLARNPDGKKIIFNQKDIREIQLAKSAVRAGLETLIRRYGIGYDEIKKIYIAGGFGYKMDINKAIGIGLLPEECRDKIEAVGNSCLEGVRLSLQDSGGESRMKGIIAKAAEVQLSNDKDFNELYVEYMCFD